jgi:hypothetical protein
VIQRIELKITQTENKTTFTPKTSQVLGHRFNKWELFKTEPEKKAKMLCKSVSINTVPF